MIPTNARSRQAHFISPKMAESDFDPLPFDAAAARASGRVAAELRRAGCRPAARAYDALIAATAISVRLPLFTCNPSDFSGMPDLDLRVVPHPDQR